MVSATGAATATPESPGGGTESPLIGVESEYDTDNSSNISIQTASSVETTTEDYGNVPPETMLASIGARDGDVAINEIVPTEDGNYLLIITVINSTISDGAIAKFTPEGSPIWNTRFRKNGQQAFVSGIQTQSGEYVLSGWTETANSYTGWAVKIDEDGDKIWESEPSGFSQEIFHDVEETADGEYLFAGEYVSSEGDDNAVVTKTTSSGELLWNNYYWDQQERNPQNFFGIERISTNQYVAVGQEYQDGSFDGWTFSIDSDGEILGGDTRGHSIFDDWLNDVAVTDNGDLIYSGVTNGNYDSGNNEYISSEGWLFYDTLDDQNQWSESISVDTVNRFSAVDVTDNRIVAAGHTSQNDGVGRSRMIVEYDLDGSRNWLDTNDNGLDQDADGVLVEGTETFVVGEKQRTTDGGYSGYIWQYDSTGVVKLTNVSIDSGTSGTVISGSTSQHTLSFEALHVSADNSTDEFTITIPDSVTLEQVNDVTVESPLYDINETVNGNEITFQVNPDDTIESVDLSITAEIELSAGTTDSRGPTEGTEWDVTITRVIDGDTVEAEFPNGEVDTIRLLGVDTPETSFNSVSPSEFEGITDTTAGRDHLFSWGNNATDYAKQRLSGQEVNVVVDEQADRRGSFGRLLAYIYVDGQNFNEQLLTDGYARLYESDFSKRSVFETAEQNAQDRDAGLWNFNDDMSDQPSSSIAVNFIHEDAEGNDNENLNDEYIVFTNAGSSEVDMSGWSISDEADHTYTVPSEFTLDSGEDMILYTGSGTNGGTVLYWGEESAVWNNGGDTITVEDEGGTVVLQRQY